MDVHGFPLISMEIHDPWIPSDTHENPWISMDAHRCPWISMEILRNPWTSMDIHIEFSIKDPQSQALGLQHWQQQL
jgi:hypothetical protein